MSRLWLERLRPWLTRSLEALPILLFVFSLCLASFTFGALVMGLGWRPSHPLTAMGAAADSLYEKYSYVLASHFGSLQHKRLKNLWYESPEPGKGVLINEVPGADDVLLFSDCTSSAQLIDRAGKKIYDWQFPFYQAFPEPKQILDAVPEEQIYWRNVFVAPDGTLTAIYEGLNQTPYGGGLVQVDRDSHLKWATPINANHDLTFLPDGTILVLYHEYVEGRIEDQLAYVDGRTGKVKESFPLFPAFHDSTYRWLMPKEPEGDYLHTNSVLVLDDAWASECSFGHAGDILMSHNRPAILSLVDGKTRKVVWAMTGVSQGLHDPDMLPGCRIGFFDNRGGRVRGDKAPNSRVMIFDTKTLAVTVRYEDPGSFMSGTRGSLEWLPNDHVVITESNQATIFEIDAQGKTVWKYINERRDEKSVCVVNETKVIPRSQLTFLAGAGAPKP